MNGGSVRKALSMGLALAVSLVFCSGAAATVTIGSQMTSTDIISAGACASASSCTHAQSVLPSGVVTSPVNGTVVRWKAPWSNPGAARLRITRALPGIGEGRDFLRSSAVEAMVRHDLGENSFATSLPISIGDGIAVDDLADLGNPIGKATPGAIEPTYSPIVADGASGLATATVVDVELYLSATIEPTSAFTLSPPKARRKTKTAGLSATLPNPGVLEISGGGVKPLTVSVANPGPVAITLKPTGSTAKHVARKGKSRVKPTFRFTPSFGSPSTQVMAIKLKGKRKS
jgi:hypothetical protein